MIPPVIDHGSHQGGRTTALRMKAVGLVVFSRSRRIKPKKEEEEFLRAVEVGDLPSVRKLLISHKNLNVNCTDILGRTPMRLAVENEHQDIVELLLDKSHPRHLYESLLLAISLDHDDIAETILKHPVYEKLERQSSYSGSNFYQTLISEDSQFSAETTPLILAAQRNRFQIVSLLIKKGQRIEKPHKHNCKCTHCKAQIALDELRYAKSRLNAYKGLASDAYIAISSDDPVLTAFELGQELRQVATKEKHYRAEYEALAQKMSDFVVKLLDQVRGNEELDLILNEQISDRHADCHGKLARLKLAIKLNEKQFVAHPSCQKKLTSIWYHDVQFHRLPLMLRPGFVIVLTVLFPVLAVIYWLMPTSKIGTFLRTPFIKFIGQSMSFFIFLTLIVTFSFTETPSSGTLSHAKNHLVLDAFHQHFNDTRHNLTGIYKQLHILQLRQFRPGIFQVLICLWIVGLLWQELKQLYYEGVDGYISSLFNMIDFFSLKMYIASFTLRYLSYFKTREALIYFTQKESWDKLVAKNYEALYQVYWLIADRYFWDDWDPTYICEGIFAVANVLSFSRLFYLLAANEQLGPLQVSLRRMIGDIMRFFMIFSIVFWAFLVGLNNLYWYYEPTVREVVEEHSQHGISLETRAEDAFGTIELTFRTVYWALFGMGDRQVVEVGDNYSKAFTERIGYIVYGAYNMCAAVVLLNMLIAMMSRSFDIIQNEEHVEWKFARAQLYMDYIQEGSTLPPPLNIVPSPKSLFRIFSPCFYCFKRVCGRSYEKKRSSLRKNTTYDSGLVQTPNDNETDYANIEKPNYKDRGNSRTFKSSSGSNSSSGSKRLQHQIYDICEEEEHMELDGMSSASTKPSRINKRGTSVTSSRGVTSDESLEPLTNDLDVSTPEPKREKLTFQAVMKSVVKRYIFESQKDESSPLEGEIEELKQDLSSFRYEMLNHLATHQSALQDHVSDVDGKVDRLLELFSAIYAGSSTPTQQHHIPLTATTSVPPNQRYAFTQPSTHTTAHPSAHPSAHTSTHIPQTLRHRSLGGSSSACVDSTLIGDTTSPQNGDSPNVFSPVQSDRPFISEGNSPIREPPPYTSATNFGTHGNGHDSHVPTRTLDRSLSGSSGSLPCETSSISPTVSPGADNNKNNAPTSWCPAPQGGDGVRGPKPMRSTSLTGDASALRRNKLHAQSERGTRKRQPFDMDITQLRHPNDGSPGTGPKPSEVSEVPSESTDLKQQDMENFMKLLEQNIPVKK